MSISADQMTKKVQSVIEQMRALAPVPAAKCASSPHARNVITCTTATNSDQIWLVTQETNGKVDNYDFILSLVDGAPPHVVTDRFTNLCVALLTASDPRLNRRSAASMLETMNRRALNATRGTQPADDRRDLPGGVVFTFGVVPKGSLSCSLMQDEH